MARASCKTTINNTEGLSSLLSRVHLKGLNEECLLVVKRGKGLVEAVDRSNNVFLHCEAPVSGLEDGNLGLTNLSLLVRFLEGDASITFTATNEWLKLRKAGSGEIKILLLDPEQVPTKAPKLEVPLQTMVDNTPLRIDLTESMVEQMLYYMGLIDSVSVNFVAKNGAVFFSNEESSEQQFKNRVGKYFGEGDASVRVYSTHLKPILSSLNFGEGVEPHIKFGPESPFIVAQDGKNLWALSPIEVAL